MTFKRRDFLKMLGAAGIATTILPSGAYAEESYEGDLLLTINAIGGWDVTNFCDPKGGKINERFDFDKIKTTKTSTESGITYAPLDNNADLFTTYRDNLLVINGIDMSTNGHFEGQRHAWSGALSDNNTPSLAALFAAQRLQGKNVPAPFISYGGFSKTGDLVPLTRLSSLGDLDTVGRYERWRGLPRAARYIDDLAMESIEAAREARHARRHIKETLPKFKKARAELFTTQTSASLLRRYQEYLPAVNNTYSTSENMAAISLAALKAGLGAAASIYVGDFDTHKSHEELHAPLLINLVQTIIFAIERARTLGLEDRLTIVVGSEFSRTPTYNDNSKGKDHWPVGSMLVISPGGSPVIRGNRVVGATDEKLILKTVDLDTLELDEAGKRLTPALIHTALRHHLGIQDFAESRNFDLRQKLIPLFT